jgi:hypothetical protein
VPAGVVAKVRTPGRLAPMRPPHVPNPEGGPWWASDLAVLLVCIAALLVILLCPGCQHAPPPNQPDLFRDCKPCRVPPTSDGEHGWCA